MADFATDFYKIEVKNPIGVTAPIKHIGRTFAEKSTG